MPWNFQHWENSAIGMGCPILLPLAPMAVDLPAKLRVTSAALGCVTRKDLCARFRLVNAATHFDLERSHKWMQGKAEPRSSTIYEDWAQVLGTARPPAWISACTLSAFVEEVARLFEADPATLRRAAGPAAQDPVPTGPAGQGHGQTGLYACYSPAWSPHFQGQLIRGGLRITQGRRREMLAIYTERLSIGSVSFQGVARQGHRTLTAHLLDAEEEYPLFLCLYLSGAPASALGGIMSGSTVLAQDSCPTSCRFAAVRVPEAAPLEATNRYLQPAEGAIAADLAALGLPASACPAIEAAVRILLDGAPVNQVPISAQARLAQAADPAYLETLAAKR